MSDIEKNHVKMQHAKKFLLFSVNGLKRYKEKQKLSDSENHISNNSKLNSQDLIAEMREKLSSFLHKDGNMPLDTKNELYGQQQYEFFDRRDAMKRKNSNNNGDGKNNSKRLKTGPIPKSAAEYFKWFYPETAGRLAQFIMEHVPRLQWNAKSEISIDGQIIPGSNLKDLMEDVLRKHRSFEPAGYMEFAAVLKEAGLPANLVGETTGVYIANARKQNVKAERTLQLEDPEDDNANDGYEGEDGEDAVNNSHHSSLRDVSGRSGGDDDDVKFPGFSPGSYSITPQHHYRRPPTVTRSGASRMTPR